MSSWVEMELLERIPIGYIVYAFVSGIVILSLSPVTLLLPSWMANPYSSADPSRTLSSMLVISTSAFIPGILMRFSSGAVECLNEKLGRRLWKDINKRSENRRPYECKIKFTAQQTVDFAEWSKKTRAYTEFLNFQENVVYAAIHVSEIVIPANLITTILLGCLHDARLCTSILALLFSFFFGVSFYLYDHYRFRNANAKNWEKIYNRFLETNEAERQRVALSRK